MKIKYVNLIKKADTLPKPRFLFKATIILGYLGFLCVKPQPSSAMQSSFSFQPRNISRMAQFPPKLDNVVSNIRNSTFHFKIDDVIHVPKRNVQLRATPKDGVSSNKPKKRLVWLKKEDAILIAFPNRKRNHLFSFYISNYRIEVKHPLEHASMY